jgi:hypothetical protein
VGETGVVVRWIMGDASEYVIVCNLGATPLTVDAVEGDALFESRGGDADSVRKGRLPARCTVVFLLART